MRAVVALVAFALFVCGDSKALEIEVQPIRAQMVLGQPIELAIRVLNNGAMPAIFLRPRSIGRDSISIHASSRGCEYDARPIRLTSEAGDDRFFSIPLFPRDEFSFRLLPINEVESESVVWIPRLRAGSYVFVIELAGSEMDAAPGNGPGSIKPTVTKPVTVRLLNPPSREVEIERERLAACLAEPTCVFDQSVEYFRVVPASNVVPSLVRLLERDPNDIRLAEAVFAQGQQGDEESLLRVAKDPRTIREHREYYVELAGLLVSALKRNCR
ncbi:MAG: hypothetical protein U0X73_12230 [Thermoanaerobaculia bacterium]